jgi:hypothetical protein
MDRAALSRRRRSPTAAARAAPAPAQDTRVNELVAYARAAAHRLLVVIRVAETSGNRTRNNVADQLDLAHEEVVMALGIARDMVEHRPARR